MTVDVPVLPRTGVGDLSPFAANRVGAASQTAPDSRWEDGVTVRRTTTGVTVYVNGDPVCRRRDWLTT